MGAPYCMNCGDLNAGLHLTRIDDRPICDACLPSFVAGARPDAVRRPAEDPEPKRPTFDQLWLTLCPGDDESGVVRISEIESVLRYGTKTDGRVILQERGVVISMRSGEDIEAPDALYSEVKLALMAAEVTS